MHAAITGASGHLGNALVRDLLNAGHRVRAGALDDCASLAGLDCETFRLDVTEPASLDGFFEGVDVVFHLAALISIAGDRDGLVQRVNGEGPAHVARAAHAAGVRRMVHVSSIHAFLADPRDEVVTEQRPRAHSARNAYDRSKAIGEDRAREVADATGLELIVVHPSGCLGPYDGGPSRMGRTLLDMARRPRAFVPDGGFDWVDTRDVASTLVAAAASGTPGRRYLASGHWSSMADVAALVSTALGRQPRVTSLPLAPFLVAGRVLESIGRVTGRESLLTWEAVDAMRNYREIDHSRATTELGHSPRPLAETIADSLAWLHAHGHSRHPVVETRP